MPTDFAAFLQPEYLRSLEQLRASQVETFVAQEEWVVSLGKSGWTLPSFATPGEVKYLQLNFADDIDEGFRWFYASDSGARIELLRDSLMNCSQIATWHPLIGEAFKAYHHGLNRVVVPSLLSVLDAVISTAGGTLNRRSNVKAVVDSSAKASERGLGRLIAMSVQAFVGQVFRSHDFSAEPPSLMNRHWVLHGRDAGNLSQADSLRLFQAIDTIGMQLSAVAFDPRTLLPPELVAKLPDDVWVRQKNSYRPAESPSAAANEQP